MLTVRVPDAAPDNLVADALVELGARAVEERDDGYVTHLSPPADPDGFLDEVRRRLEDLPGVGRVELSTRWQPHEAWTEIWKEGLEPRRVTPRIVVTPTWKEPGDLGTDEVVIRLDPGVAFGTAEHATTRGCLRLLDGAVETGDRVADVGSGTGILAIAAIHLGAADVVAVEADPMACETARENLEANGVSERVRVVEARMGPEEVAALGPRDGIVANIEAGVLSSLMPGLARALAPGGWLVLGGVLATDRDRMAERAGSRGLRLEAEEREDGWWSARFRAAPAVEGDETGF